MSYRDYYGGYSRGYRRADDQLGAYSDWDRTGGGCCCGGGGYGGGDASLFSDGTLFALLAGAALAFYVLYTTLTAAAAAKRKKRSVSGGVHLEDDEEDPLLQHLGDFLGAGRSHGSLSNSNSIMAPDGIKSELFVCWWCCVSFMSGKACDGGQSNS